MGARGFRYLLAHGHPWAPATGFGMPHVRYINIIFHKCCIVQWIVKILILIFGAYEFGSFGAVYDDKFEPVFTDRIGKLYSVNGMVGVLIHLIWPIGEPR